MKENIFLLNFYFFCHYHVCVSDEKNIRNTIYLYHLDTSSPTKSKTLLKRSLNLLSFGVGYKDAQETNHLSIGEAVTIMREPNTTTLETAK